MPGASAVPIRVELNRILNLLARDRRSMSLFRKAGKKFEETKQSVLETNKAKYQCQSCGEIVEEPFEYCPHCGDAAIEKQD